MTLEELIRSLATKYSGDPSAPSVVLSYLADRERWYASAVRYCEKYGGAKVVVCNATSESLEGTLSSLASELDRIWKLQESPILFEFHVVEEHDDCAPEAFGYWIGSRPVAGDTIQLKWLDGRDAYKVLVLRVSEEQLVLKARKVNDERD